VFEYKGFFSTVNRKGIGKYCGKVTGVNDTGQDIEAASLCQLRQVFETIVDEFLHRQACGLKHSISRIKKDPPEEVN
jgi:predicted HicB family RNase H-like nuclease